MAETINEEMEAQAQLQQWMESVATPLPHEKKLSAEQRQQALAAAITETDIDRLLDLQDKMKQAIDQITATNFDPDTQLTEAQLENLMQGWLDHQEIKDLLTVWYAMIRTRVFAHITEVNAIKGFEDPEIAPGEVPVPSMGRKFVRQGGKAQFDLDEEKLAEKLGPNYWKKVRKAVLVPAVPEHIEYHLDHNAMVELVNEDPTVMEVFRECVVTGKRSTISFHVRDLKE